MEAEAEAEDQEVEEGAEEEEGTETAEGVAQEAVAGSSTRTRLHTRLLTRSARRSRETTGRGRPRRLHLRCGSEPTRTLSYRAVLTTAISTPLWAVERAPL